MQPCFLYPNRDPPQENLFVANAALWTCTGDQYYHNQADRWYDQGPLDMFLLSWNSVVPQVCFCRVCCVLCAVLFFVPRNSGVPQVRCCTSPLCNHLLCAASLSILPPLRRAARILLGQDEV